MYFSLECHANDVALGCWTSEEFEVATDEQRRPAIDALGDGIDELFAIMARGVSRFERVTAL